MIEFGAGGTLVHSESNDPDPAPTTPAPAATPAAGETGVTPAEGETNATTAAAADGAEGNSGGPSTATGNSLLSGLPPTPAPAPVPQVNPRRKRKPKGWSCPVCRQPYTSMLRITTAPPPSKHTDDADAENDNEKDITEEDHHDTDADGAGPPPSANPLLPNAPPGSPLTANANGAGEDVGSGNGTTGSSRFRPGFLRAFSRGGQGAGQDAASAV
ncbi:hypothetical protein K474DRAFT_935495 [Panus rudis PR-1116 ss-1]|nr:hypothetical protein K474DRAFT_935495 [Panus rudis PR-1116 ss-1]